MEHLCVSMKNDKWNLVGCTRNVYCIFMGISMEIILAIIKSFSMAKQKYATMQTVFVSPHLLIRKCILSFYINMIINIHTECEREREWAK